MNSRNRYGCNLRDRRVCISIFEVCKQSNYGGTRNPRVPLPSPSTEKRLRSFYPILMLL